MLQAANPSPLRHSTRTTTPWFIPGVTMLIVTSVVSNLLILTGPIFMLQIYDRVLPSRSLPSLLALSVIAVGLYAFYALIEVIRSRISVRLARAMEGRIRPRIIRAMVEEAPSIRGDLFASADVVRTFTSGPGPMTLLDLPWMAIFLGLIFLMHPLLGQVTLGGVTVTIILLVIHELRTRPLSRAVSAGVQDRTSMMHDIRAASDAIRAMAMQFPLANRLGALVSGLDRTSTKASDRAALYTAMTRASRLALQSTVLATGAYLVIIGESTGGIIISASILSSRAVAPVEQAVAHWQGFIAAREALGRLLPFIRREDPYTAIVTLPPPSARLDVIDLEVTAPGGGPTIIEGISFGLQAGDALCVIGSSGSGKSTLARALVGAIKAKSGEIRLDENLLEHYDPVVLGRAVGYLPQEVSLLAGTVAENISRHGNASSDAIQKAAAAADIGPLVARLPNGYETAIGERGAMLSAGQRQRVGLARALYEDPFLIVLDEPNSNLDAPGEAALTAAVLAARQRGAIVVVVAHRASAISSVNKLLMLQDGKQVLFGPRDEVLRKIGGTASGRAAREATNAAA